MPLLSAHCWRRSRKLSITWWVISCGMAAISWRMVYFNCSIDRGLRVYTFDFKYPHKKSHGFKSGDRPTDITAQWDQMTGEHHPQNRHRTFRSVGCCPILLKPNIVSIVKFTKSGLRKVSSNTQYRSVNSHCNIVFQKERTQNDKFCYRTPCGYTRTMQGTFVQLTRVVLGPISEILLIHTSAQVKMVLVTEKQKSSRENMLMNFQTLFCDSHGLFRWVPVSFCMDAFVDPGEEFFAESLREAACFLAERRGDCRIEALTAATLFGVLAVRGRSVDFRFSVDPLALKLVTHNKIVFRVGMGLFLPSLKFTRNALCFAFTDALLLINVNTMKARCSPVQSIWVT